MSIGVALFTPPQVVGLSGSDQDTLHSLLRVWQRKYPRNIVRTQYLDGRNALRDLGISMPPFLADMLEVAVGWPEKAVYGLAQRCMWDGVVTPSGQDDPMGLRELLKANRFDIELPEAIVSSMTHSLAFASVTPGDEAAGEPPVLIQFHSALFAAGLWDSRRRQLKAALVINEVDSLGRPTRITMFTPFEILVLAAGNGAWYIDWKTQHTLRRVPVEPLPFRPTLDRPFGRSRINRKVMSITDRAVRTAARMDIHAELYSAPKFLLLGADDGIYRDANGNPIPLWKWYLTRMGTISRDENGEIPSLEKIGQESPQPHIEMMRQLAAEFSGETGIPMSSLGVVHDNPASAEAIYAAKEDLVIEATAANRVYGAGLARVYQNTVMIRDNLFEVPDELREVSSKWRNPAFPSVVSSSDAMVKQIQAIPALARTTVALEEFGYTDEQILRIKADIERGEAADRLDALIAVGESGEP